MVPMSTVSKISMMTGPDILQRYNMFRTAEINGANGPGRLDRTGPRQSWKNLSPKSFRRATATNGPASPTRRRKQAARKGPIFGMAMVFVFLVLAAQYESWAVPFSVLLGLPIGVFGAFLGVTLVGLENNVYVQIGIVALMGLAAKNAILIVEFAKEGHEKKGMGLVAAATEGAKLRFRPIMMTAFAFILGVVPLVMASGAGAAARVSIGIAVFAGMLMASTVGLFFIPMLYVVDSKRRLPGSPVTKGAIKGSPGGQPVLEGGHALMRRKLSCLCMPWCFAPAAGRSEL